MPADIIITNFNNEAKELIRNLMVKIVEGNGIVKSPPQTLMFQNQQYDSAESWIERLFTANYPPLKQQQFLFDMDPNLQIIRVELDATATNLEKTLSSKEFRITQIEAINEDKFPLAIAGYRKRLRKQELCYTKLERTFKEKESAYKERLETLKTRLLKCIRPYSTDLSDSQYTIDIRKGISDQDPQTTLLLPRRIADIPLSSEDFKTIESDKIKQSEHIGQILRALKARRSSLLDHLSNYKCETHELIQFIHKEALEQKNNESKALNTALFKYYKDLANIHNERNEMTDAVVIAAQACVFPAIERKIPTFFKATSSCLVVPELKGDLNDEYLKLTISLYFIDKIQKCLTKQQLSHKQVNKCATPLLKLNAQEQVLAKKLLTLIPASKQSTADQQRTSSP